MGIAATQSPSMVDGSMMQMNRLLFHLAKKDSIIAPQLKRSPAPSWIFEEGTFSSTLESRRSY